MEEIKEVEPTMVYPVKEDHVYAVCRCPLPMEYALDLGEKQPGKQRSFNENRFIFLSS